MWLLGQLLPGPPEAAVKVQVTVKNCANFYPEGALELYFTDVQFLLTRYVTDDNIAKLDAEVRSLRK